MAAISSVQRMGWPVSASTLAAASRALRGWLPESAGRAAWVFGALGALAVFVAGVLAGFFLVAIMLLLKVGYQTSTATLPLLERSAPVPHPLAHTQAQPPPHSLPSP